MKKNKQNKGFTLIELMVVILIIAVLGAMGMVAYGQANKSARDGKRKADIESIRQALILYRTENGCYPASHNSIVPTYISTMPTDPQPSSYSYGYSPTNGWITCPGTGATGANGFILTYYSEKLGTTVTLTNP